MHSKPDVLPVECQKDYHKVQQADSSYAIEHVQPQISVRRAKDRDKPRCRCSDSEKGNWPEWNGEADGCRCAAIHWLETILPLANIAPGLRITVSASSTRYDNKLTGCGPQCDLRIERCRWSSGSPCSQALHMNRVPTKAWCENGTQLRVLVLLCHADPTHGTRLWWCMNTSLLC